MSSPIDEGVASPPGPGSTSTIGSPTTKRAAKRGDRFILETRALVQHLQTINFEPHIQPLRPAHTFTLIVPKRVRECRKGGANLHIPILWDDGVKWLIRIKLHWTVSFGEVKREIRRLILESERETMITLKGVGLAVPEVYGPVVVTDDIEYIVVECIEGTPCSRRIHHSLSGAPLDRLIRQFAESQIKLSTLTFQAIGSLFPSPAGPTDPSRPSIPTIGPSISLRFVNPEPPYFLGPFKTAGRRYMANIELMLLKLEHGDKTLGHPAVVYLVHLWYRDIIRTIPALWDTEEIMIRHADDQGDHILSNPEGDLRGIIDWEWAVTTTKSDAFAAPMGLVDIPRFQSGSNDLSVPEQRLVEAYTELGRVDLADCVRGGKVHQRLWSCIGSRPAIGKIKGLTSLSPETSETDISESAVGLAVDVDLARWCRVMAERYKENEVLRRLMDGDQLSWAERCAIKEGVELMSSP